MAKRTKPVQEAKPEPVIACFVNANTWRALDAKDGMVLSGWSEKEVEEIATRTDVRAVLVEAELNGGNAEYQYLYGLQLARDLRVKHKVRWPIVVSSALPWDLYLSQLNGTNVDENMRVLLGCGTIFIHQRELSKSSIGSTLKEHGDLDTSELIDLNLSLLEERGYLLFLLDHDIKEGAVQAREPLVDRLVAGASALGVSISEEQIETLISGGGSKFKAAKDAIRHQIELATRSPDPGSGPQDPNSRPTVLLVEDNPEHQKRICATLSGPYHVIPVSNAVAALQAIDRDKSFSISAVIADWRLKEEDGKWQRMQGHKLLDEIAKRHPAPLFALTSIDEFYLHVLFGHMNSRPSLWRKSHFDAHPEVLMDQLAQAIRTHMLDVSSYPDCKRWEQHYRPLYIAQRQKHEWSSFNAEIGDDAKYLIEQAKDQIDRQLGNGTEPHMMEFTEIKYDDLGLSFGKKGALRDFLILRRYFLGVFFYLAKKGVAPPALYQHTERLDKASSTKLDLAAWAATLIFVVDDPQNNKAKVKEKVKNMVNTAMGIKPGALPHHGLLREERTWLAEVKVPANFDAF